MRRIVDSLNVLAWPMWLKLTAGFIFAVIIPVALITLVVQNGFTQISAGTLEGYVREQGERQQHIITSELELSQSNLSVLANTRENRDLFLKVFLNSFATGKDLRDVGAILQSAIVNSDDYSAVRLVDVTGVVLANVNTTDILTPRLRDSDNPTFIQASNALLQSRKRSSIIYQPADADIIFEITESVVDNDNNVIGFLIATLNVQHLLLDNLTFQGEVYPAYSFLVTSGRTALVITPPETREQAESSADDSVAVAAAFRIQESKTAQYQTGAARNIEVMGYSGSIADPANTNQALFALITEVPTSAPAQQAAQYFGGARVFVVGVGLVLVLLVLVLLFNQLITPPLTGLRRAIQSVAQGQFNDPVPSAGRGDEIGELGAAFVDMRVQVRTLLDELEARVAARTRDISATQEISRFAATQRDLQTLMDQVVELIIERFPNIYHAQIFLLDRDRLYAVLRASTGDVGRMLLGRGHRLAVGSISVIGQVTEQSQVVIARDTAASAVHRRNEFLPETRAELAIPLKTGDIVIGALDVQSKFRNAFADDEIRILETMADQIAVAIENARLYQESLRRMEDVERNNRQKTLQTWQEYVYGQRQRQLSSQAGVATGNDLSELRRRAVATGRVAIGEITANSTVPIAVPIQLRDQILGAVEWELPAALMNDNKLQLAQELANRLAVSLENARLFQESQRATERERIVNSIAAKLTPQTEIDEILRTAVREVGQALRAPQVSIRLNRPNGNSANGNGSNGNGSNGNGSNGEH